MMRRRIQHDSHGSTRATGWKFELLTIGVAAMLSAGAIVVILAIGTALEYLLGVHP